MTDISAFAANLDALIKLQRSAYLRDGFPTAEIRLGRLQRTAALLAENKDRIADALSRDFGHRSHDETRIGLLGALGALRYAATNLESWLQPEQYTPMTPDARARVEYTPRGVVGVIGPWNFPIVTVFGPLAAILAAGNRAIIKPSELTPVTSALLAELVADRFAPSEVTVVQGAAEEGEIFAASALDHLIFTGSASVAKHVMRAAASNLTPVTLELGGKSPAIVTEQFDLAEAARRIMAVKTRNAGQVCLAPDYALVPRALEREFAAACVAAVEQMFPQGVDSNEYTSIISDRHYRRLEAMIADARANGAEVIEALPARKANDGRRLAPTLLLNVNDNMMAMREEIFGPVLPIVGYYHLDEALAFIRSRPHPLGLYYFGADDQQGRKVLDGTASGGVTINDVMVHMFGADMPFGGVGASGMGCYFGKAGFHTFSHARAIYRQGESDSAAEIFRPPYGERLQQILAAAIAQ
ncbi:coniferyl aldehyde dehydrogenase [Bradyrhizobium sp. Ai1a-2]|uniref:coniferyl aldehyde dehydrogenase n=1 Tax=Bradyrhizobium sp. Ai1a-2 TaxID=196490 RepID=UPI0003F7852B|nr:coniferyl aldehyde dehydrogenase [Bradyrhizobium sp. Ai1a-2]